MEQQNYALQSLKDTQHTVSLRLVGKGVFLEPSPRWPSLILAHKPRKYNPPLHLGCSHEVWRQVDEEGVQEDQRWRCGGASQDVVLRFVSLDRLLTLFVLNSVSFSYARTFNLSLKI